MSWRTDAVCQKLPFAAKLMFFGDAPGGATTMTQNRYAQTICYSCPVQVECLMACMEINGDGVWGGLSDSQRKRYLLPAIRRRGNDPEVYREVIAACDGLRHASDKVEQIAQLVSSM